MLSLDTIEPMEHDPWAPDGNDLPEPPGWRAAQPKDADLLWRPVPDPVDGSLIQDPDFTLPTAAGPLAWRLFYDSGQANTNSEWGYGRQASFPLRLISDGTTVTVMRDDGLVRQYRNIAGTFTPQGPPSADTLVKQGDGTWDETRGDTGFKFHYPAGNYVSLAYWQNPQGYRITCNYDGSQRLSWLTEPAGRRVTLGYTAQGQVQYIQDWGDRRNTLAYNAAGEMISMQGPTGCVTSFGYSASGHLLTYINDPMGFVTTYTYDAANRVATRSVAGNLGRYTYQSSGSIVTMGYTDPLGNTWTHVSSGGYPSAAIDPLGNVQTFAYSGGRPLSFKDGLGNIRSFSFDATTGHQLGETSPLGGITTITRDSSGNILTHVDPAGVCITHSYGANPGNRQVQTVLYASGHLFTYGYTAAGLPQSVANPRGCTTYIWDTAGYGHKVNECNALGCGWSHSYDLVGNRQVQTDPCGCVWTSSYDGMGRVIEVQNMLGHRQTTVYDSRGMVRMEIDAGGCITTYSWDAYGNQTEQLDPLGRRWTWFYDAKGRVTCTMDPTGARTTHFYDKADRRIATMDPTGRIVTSFYDAAGRICARQAPDATLTTFSYNAGAGDGSAAPERAPAHERLRRGRPRGRPGRSIGAAHDGDL